MENVSSRKDSLAFTIVRIAVLAALTGLFLYLFYGEASGKFYSDIPGHIRFATSESQSSYSLMYPLLAFSHGVGGPFGVAVLLTILEMATIVVSERFLRALAPDARREAIFVFAIILNFAIAIHLPFLHSRYMVGLSAGNSWHNGTFLGMKLASLGAIWAYLRFIGYLKSKHPMVDYFVMTLLIIVSASTKPSFVVVFGPTLVIVCIMDLIREGKSTLKRSLMLSIPFFIVLAILAYQYMVLYVEDTSSGIELGIARVWRHTHFFFPIAMLQSWAFPILVYVFCRTFAKGDRNYRMMILMFFIALAIFLFVNESGLRKYHGNFGWSLKFAVYYLFLTSIAVFCNTRGKRLKLITVPPVTAGATAGAAAGLAVAADAGDLAPSQATPEGQDLDSDGSAGSPAPDAVWPDVLILVMLAWHFASGVGNIINILNGNGYA